VWVTSTSPPFASAATRAPDVNGHPLDGFAVELDLPRVAASSDLQPRLTKRHPDGLRATHRTRRPVEGCQDPIARALRAPREIFPARRLTAPVCKPRITVVSHALTPSHCSIVVLQATSRSADGRWHDRTRGTSPG
jgi:hypothetical protein